MSQAAWDRLRRSVIACQRCPRLIQHCQTVAIEKRKAYREQKYWGKPVPNFGDHHAQLLVVGLAPGAHGANRTGRMFTGDRSGEWLYRAMHRAGFANQPHSENQRDGLQLIDAAITNVVHCAPPDNKPTNEEQRNCESYFKETLLLVDPTVIIALGNLAWRSTVKALIESQRFEKRGALPKFGHAETLELNANQTLIGCYHPSQQNTFTGRLTEPMLDSVFQEARRRIDWVRGG